MNPVDLDFTLPCWNVPPPRRVSLSPEAWVEWLEENLRELRRTGHLEKLRMDPARRPVDVRFVL